MDCRELPERLDRKVIYESDYVCLYSDKVKLSNGYIIEKYHQIHYPHEAISIVVFNENDEALLIQSKRYTVVCLEWEIPAGRVEDGESKEEATRQECMEETGCTVIKLLGCFKLCDLHSNTLYIKLCTGNIFPKRRRNAL